MIPRRELKAVIESETKHKEDAAKVMAERARLMLGILGIPFGDLSIPSLPDDADHRDQQNDLAYLQELFSMLGFSVEELEARKAAEKRAKELREHKDAKEEQKKLTAEEVAKEERNTEISTNIIRQQERFQEWNTYLHGKSLDTWKIAAWAQQGGESKDINFAGTQAFCAALHATCVALPDALFIASPFQLAKISAGLQSILRFIAACENKIRTTYRGNTRAFSEFLGQVKAKITHYLSEECLYVTRNLATHAYDIQPLIESFNRRWEDEKQKAVSLFIPDPRYTTPEMKLSSLGGVAVLGRELEWDAPDENDHSAAAEQARKELQNRIKKVQDRSVAIFLGDYYANHMFTRDPERNAQSRKILNEFEKRLVQEQNGRSSCLHSPPASTIDPYGVLGLKPNEEKKEAKREGVRKELVKPGTIERYMRLVLSNPAAVYAYALELIAIHWDYYVSFVQRLGFSAERMTVLSSCGLRYNEQSHTWSGPDLRTPDEVLDFLLKVITALNKSKRGEEAGVESTRIEYSQLAGLLANLALYFSRAGGRSLIMQITALQATINDILISTAKMEWQARSLSGGLIRASESGAQAIGFLKLSSEQTTRLRQSLDAQQKLIAEATALDTETTTNLNRAFEIEEKSSAQTMILQRKVFALEAVVAQMKEDQGKSRIEMEQAYNALLKLASDEYKASLEQRTALLSDVEALTQSLSKLQENINKLTAPGAAEAADNASQQAMLKELGDIQAKLAQKKDLLNSTQRKILKYEETLELADDSRNRANAAFDATETNVEKLLRSCAKLEGRLTRHLESQQELHKVLDTVDQSALQQRRKIDEMAKKAAEAEKHAEAAEKAREAAEIKQKETQERIDIAKNEAKQLAEELKQTLAKVEEAKQQATELKLSALNTQHAANILRMLNCDDYRHLFDFYHDTIQLQGRADDLRLLEQLNQLVQLSITGRVGNQDPNLELKLQAKAIIEVLRYQQVRKNRYHKIEPSKQTESDKRELASILEKQRETTATFSEFSLGTSSIEKMETTLKAHRHGGLHIFDATSIYKYRGALGEAREQELEKERLAAANKEIPVEGEHR
ncbi:MAG: hypothetical protein M1561_03830 [Gammaproteobacteria bacterium]|nr:hypothetical protein [Gammaproteobacteria bacterium]